MVLIDDQEEEDEFEINVDETVTKDSDEDDEREYCKFTDIDCAKQTISVCRETNSALMDVGKCFVEHYSGHDKILIIMIPTIIALIVLRIFFKLIGF